LSVTHHIILYTEHLLLAFFKIFLIIFFTHSKVLIFPVLKNTQNLHVKHHLKEQGKEMGALLMGQASNDQIFPFFHSFE